MLKKFTQIIDILIKIYYYIAAECLQKPVVAE